MKVLALDIATHCGWATETAYGVWDLSIKKDESKGMRLIRFKAKLKEIIPMEGIDLVAVERVSGFHKNALIVLAELHGVLKITLDEMNIPYVAYSAKEIKKFATGNGSASKAKMIEAAKIKLLYEGNDDNEADALWLYHYSLTNI